MLGRMHNKRPASRGDAESATLPPAGPRPFSPPPSTFHCAMYNPSPNCQFACRERVARVYMYSTHSVYFGIECGGCLRFCCWFGRGKYVVHVSYLV
eukprot:scaffold28515_cov101-Isochrysis_galbana.AAC.2